MLNFTVFLASCTAASFCHHTLRLSNISSDLLIYLVKTRWLFLKLISEVQVQILSIYSPIRHLVFVLVCLCLRDHSTLINADFAPTFHILATFSLSVASRLLRINLFFLLNEQISRFLGVEPFKAAHRVQV